MLDNVDDAQTTHEALRADNRRMAGELQAAADRERELTAEVARWRAYGDDRNDECNRLQRALNAAAEERDASLAREAALVAEIERMSEEVGYATMHAGGGVRARVQGALEESRRRREALAAHRKGVAGGEPCAECGAPDDRSHSRRCSFGNDEPPATSAEGRVTHDAASDALDDMRLRNSRCIEASALIDRYIAQQRALTAPSTKHDPSDPTGSALTHLTDEERARFQECFACGTYDLATADLLETINELREALALSRLDAPPDAPDGEPPAFVPYERHVQIHRSRRRWIEAATEWLGPDWSGTPDDLRTEIAKRLADAPSGDAAYRARVQKLCEAIDRNPMPFVSDGPVVSARKDLLADHPEADAAGGKHV